MSDAEQREEAVFEAALQLHGAQRGAYLDQACAGDVALRERIEGLLGALERAGGLLDEPAVTREQASHAVVIPPTAQPGDHIGSYKLLQQIGEGGCGVVYMAEQTQPVRRRVALKILKLGMDTKQVIARFEAERQALALMDHPNIAKVLDAGSTDTGRPYFVMELVRGVKITEFCDENQLPMRQRLELFIQICQAIQHAHQKGIIHRDLKPSNILVTVNDGVPLPKVIDFGIAKATTGQSLTDKTVFTAFEQFIGTPAYMSPEQAMMTSLDIDTRTDIYSLGVLLYELLTGKTPFEARELLQVGFDEMRRTIREKEPARPSTRLSTMVEGELTTAAKRRHTEAPKLINFVRGDLDWIVMKCLEKDRSQRYETANGLAMDLQRHLNSEPVIACPPSAAYRFRKLLRRNKLTFFAVSAVAMALVVGLAVALWQYTDKRRAYDRAVAAEGEQSRLRRQADREASKSRHVATFLEEMLRGVGPSVALGRDTKILRELLDQTDGRIARELMDEADVAIELRDVLVQVYLELGDYERAEALARTNLAQCRAYYSGDHSAVADALERLSQALLQLSRLSESEPLVLEAVSMRRRLAGTNHADYASALGVLASLRRQQGSVAEAESLHREAVICFRNLRQTNSTTFAQALGNLVTALYEGGKFAEAETNQLEALTLLRNLLPGEHPAVGKAMGSLAGIYEARGNFVEAEGVQREVLTMNRKLLGENHPDLAKDLNNLAGILESHGRLVEAEDLYRQALALRQQHFGTEHQLVASSMGNLANLLRMEGKLSEAEPLLRDALAIQKRILGPDHPAVSESLNNLSLILYFQQKLAEAEALMREALTVQRKINEGDYPAVAAMLRNLGRLALDQGKVADAETEFRAAAAMRGRLVGTNHPGYAAALNDLAYVLRVQGKLSEAELQFGKSLNIKKQALGAGPNYQPARLDDLAVGYTQLALTMLTRSNYTDCEVLVREWLELARRAMPDSWHTFNAHSLLGESLVGQRKFADAEPALQTGYEGMSSRQKEIPAASRPHLEAAIRRLVNLYVAWDKAAPDSGKAEKATEWKQRLTRPESTP